VRMPLPVFTFDNAFPVPMGLAAERLASWGDMLPIDTLIGVTNRDSVTKRDGLLKWLRYVRARFGENCQ
jgi:hypothetical protein